MTFAELQTLIAQGEGPRLDLKRGVPSIRDLAPAAYLAAKQLELQHLLVTFPPAWQRFQSAEFSRLVAVVVAVL